MQTIADLKELGTTQTPLFLLTFQLASGATERYCTHRVEVDGEVYEDRVLGHNLFDMRSDANEGVDSLARLSISLANTDSHCSQIEQSAGWKGAKVTARFLFFDLKNGVAASPFGACSSPQERNLIGFLELMMEILRLSPGRFQAGWSISDLTQIPISGAWRFRGHPRAKAALSR